MNLKPIGERVIVERFKAETKTTGGILLPDNAKNKPQRGKVLAIGSTLDSQGGLGLLGNDVMMRQHTLLSFQRAEMRLKTAPQRPPARSRGPGGAACSDAAASPKLQTARRIVGKSFLNIAIRGSGNRGFQSTVGIKTSATRGP